MSDKARNGWFGSVTVGPVIFCLVVVVGSMTSAVAAPSAASPREAAEASPAPDAMGGDCRALRSAVTGHPLVAGGGTVAVEPAATEGEAFRMQAVDLARYLLIDADGRFLVADGDTVGFDAVPSRAAEWRVERSDDGLTLLSAPTRRAMAVTPSGSVTLVDRAGGGGQAFRLVPATGCHVPPEAEVNVSGPQLVGDSPDAEVVGYLDAHLHITGYESLGGTIHCGEPWHPYGVTYALVDCADHEIGDGGAAVLENFLSDGNPVGTHDPVGWPTFRDWPAPSSLTHEQTYYRWIERAWRSGLRIIVNLLVENRVICEIYPLKQNSCDPMTSIHMQAQRMREMERFIDAQSGGVGKGWFRLVDDPAEARAVANRGDLAVILGMEASEPFGCRVLLGVPQCSEEDIDAELDALYEIGVRQITPVHKFDNALGGVAGDGGTKGTVINVGNLASTGEFWDFETCDTHEHGVHDNNQEILPGTGEVTELVGDLLADAAPVALPVYPPTPHCNTKGLTDLGAYTLEAMRQRGMIIDLDHMSVKTRQDALDLLEAAGYPGVISSHSWATPDAYPRIYALGGMTTPYAGGSTGFVEAWRQRRLDAGNPTEFAIGFGADSNGLAPQGEARGANAHNPVTYPFTGLGGVVIDQQVTGQRVYDINVDGVAHYGLYADWIEDLRRQAGDQIIEDLSRGAEAYLQMWEAAAASGPASPVDDPGDTAIDADADHVTEPDVERGLPATGDATPIPVGLAAAVAGVLLRWKRRATSRHPAVRSARSAARRTLPASSRSG